MKSRSVFALLILLMGMVPANVWACGDKLLPFSRGTRYHRGGGTRRSAAILVYATANSNLPKSIGNSPVELLLRKAGYRTTTVADQEGFESALRDGKWDLILVDSADTGTVLSKIPKHPAVLAVVYNGTKPEIKLAKKRFEMVVKAPTQPDKLLDSVDDALASVGAP